MLSKPILTLFGAATPLVLGVLIYGCTAGSDAGSAPVALVFQVSNAAEARSLPKGPDAIGGLGSGIANDVGDYVLANQYLRAVIDQPETDPTSRLGMLPLSNGVSPSGGTLIDLATLRDNDQWNQMSQGVIGVVTVDAGAAGTALATGGPAFVDITQNFLTTVLAGDTLTIASGPNAGSYKVGLVIDNVTLGLFVPPGATYVDDSVPPGTGTLQYAITRTTSPLDNIVVYDSATVVDTAGNPIAANRSAGLQVRLQLTGGIRNLAGGANPLTIPDGATVDPATGRLVSGATAISVVTTYRLYADTQYLTLTTEITNGSTNAFIFAVADIIITGGSSEPNIVPWTPLLGHTSLGLDQSRIVPFTSFRGRDLPGASYTHVDALTGQQIHAADGNFAAACVQLRSPATLTASTSFDWTRNLCVGGNNDVASSADVAVQLLANSIVRANPADGSNIPNGYGETSAIQGTVLNAPPGTVVTATQVDPALVFDPGMPSGASAAAGFYPSTLLGLNELLITEARPNPSSGYFSMVVPRGFAGLGGTGMVAPTGLENGTHSATYRVTVSAPGHNDQSVLVRLPNVALKTLSFDLQGETALLMLNVTDENGNRIPCQVRIIGKDIDGAGPAPATPDPVLGGPNAGFRPDERAEGTSNVVHLLDGTGSIEVPPGAYQLLITRGLEYSLARFPAPGSATDFFVASAGQVITVDDGMGNSVQLTRILDAAGLTDPDVTAPAGTGTFDSPLRAYLSADFHVHAGGSFDSAVPLEDRLASFLGTNVEILVGTEHDNLVDYRPARNSLDAKTTLDLSLMIDTQIGVESSGFVPVTLPTPPTPFNLDFGNTIGHYNAWPLVLDPTLRRNGAPPDEFRSPGDLYEDLRTAGAGIIQMNHPRYPVAELPLPPLGLGFLTNAKAGFAQPNTGAASLAAGGYNTPLRTLVSGGDGGIDDMNDPTTSESGLTAYNDFDVFELFGGELVTYDIQRLDWFALLSAGYIRTATANSDTHTVAGAPGFPRSFVFTSDTVDDSLDVSGISTMDFNDRLLPSLVQATKGTTSLAGAPVFFPATPRAGAVAGAMNVLGSSGPVVFLEVDANQDGTFDGRPGSLVPTAGAGSNTIDVRVTVLAAPWIPVDSVTLIVNGSSVATPLTGLDPMAINLGADPDFMLLTAAKYPVDGMGNPDWFSTDPADFVRVRATFTVTLTGIGAKTYPSDDWLLVEVRGATTGGDPYDALRPRGGIDVSGGAPNTAVGFTNPVFIDRSNGAGGAPDGTYNPPGVP